MIFCENPFEDEPERREPDPDDYYQSKKEEQMNKQQLIKVLKEWNDPSDQNWQKVVIAINDYLKDNGPIADPLDDINLQRIIEDHLFNAAWIYDRLQGRIATVRNKTYRGSMSKKIRKILGYTL